MHCPRYGGSDWHIHIIESKDRKRSDAENTKINRIKTKNTCINSSLLSSLCCGTIYSATTKPKKKKQHRYECQTRKAKIKCSEHSYVSAGISTKHHS